MEGRDEKPSRRRSDTESDRELTILAVDDDPAYLRYLKHVLGRAGFAVETATDGSTAIERVRDRADIDLLLLDLAMPSMDGFETARRIHDACPDSHLYTILLTGNSRSETKLRALESGFDDFLTKQSGEPEILAKIRSAARRLHMERQLFLANARLQALAMTDELTGIANRRALFRAGEAILSASRRLTVVMFDLDRFKQINDTFGHLTGDRILADVAALLKTNTRYGDMIGRYGGDEFVLLLPDTDSDEARQISERVQAKIRQLAWTIEGTVLRINSQFGVATSSPATTTLHELLAKCDASLYLGKRDRNNRPEPRVEAR